jgi:retinol dehydrogenase-12
MASLTGKVVIVTGANAGLGFETARQLYALGATVVLAARNKGRGTAAAEALSGRDSSDDARAVYLPLDLAHFQSVRSFVRQFHERFGQSNLHGLVCSAGVNSAGAKLQQEASFPGDDNGSENANFVFRVNFTSHALLAFLLLDDLRACGTELNPSQIVTVSSHMHCFCPPNIPWQSLAADPSASAYSASKLALLLLASALHRREATNNIQCTAVNPGAVASQIWRNSPALIQWVSDALFLSPSCGARPAVSCFLRRATPKNYLSARYLTPYFDLVGACGLSTCFPMKLQAVLEAAAGKLLAFRGPQVGRVSRIAMDRSEAARLLAAAEQLVARELGRTTVANF